MPNSIPVQRYSTRRGYTQFLDRLVANTYIKIMTVPRFLQGRVQVTTDMSGDAPQFTLDFSNPYTVAKAMQNVTWGHNGPGSITEILYTSTGDGDPIDVWIRFEGPSATECAITLTMLTSSANNEDPRHEGPNWNVPLDESTTEPANVIKRANISAESGVLLPDLIVNPDPSDPDNNTQYMERDLSGLNNSRFIGLVRFPGFVSGEAMSVRGLVSTGIDSDQNSVEFFAAFRHQGASITGTVSLISKINAGTKQSNLITTGWDNGALALYSNWITGNATGKLQYLITHLNLDGTMQDLTYLGASPPSKGVYGEISH